MTRAARIAAELSGNRERLWELHLGMRDRLLTSPLMDHRGVARKLETAYRRM